MSVLSVEWGVEYLAPDGHRFTLRFDDRASAERELHTPIPSSNRALHLVVRMVTDWARA